MCLSNSAYMQVNLTSLIKMKKWQFWGPHWIPFPFHKIPKNSKKNKKWDKGIVLFLLNWLYAGNGVHTFLNVKMVKGFVPTLFEKNKQYLYYLQLQFNTKSFIASLYYFIKIWPFVPIQSNGFLLWHAVSLQTWKYRLPNAIALSLKTLNGLICSQYTMPQDL